MLNDRCTVITKSYFTNDSHSWTLDINTLPGERRWLVERLKLPAGFNLVDIINVTGKLIYVRNGKIEKIENLEVQVLFAYQMICQLATETVSLARVIRFNKFSLSIFPLSTDV